MGDYLTTPQLPSPYIKYISAGYRHTCTIIFDDSVMCWGYNVNGLLGIGNNLQMR